MLYQITHTTTYEYSAPVSLCQNLAHLTPRNTATQQCRSTTLLVTPQPAVTTSRRDYFGNQQTFFAVQEAHRSLTITAGHHVEVASPADPAPASTPAWDAVRDRLRSSRAPVELEAYQFAFASPHVPLSDESSGYAQTSFPAGRPLGEAVLDLTQRIFRDFQYDAEATTVATPVAEVFARRRGVCQDYSHLQLSCLRSLGLAARYVSGYLRTTSVPDQPRLIGADATHAWVSVYVPDVGWLDVDPTNNLRPSDQHIVLAWGRDFADVTPVKGVILGGEQHTVKVAVDVVEVAEP